MEKTKVYLPNFDEVAEIIKVEDKWTSFPHGSGTDYKVFTIKGKDSYTDSYTFEHSCPNMENNIHLVIFSWQVEEENAVLESRIEDYKQRILENNEILKKLL